MNHHLDNKSAPDTDDNKLDCEIQEVIDRLDQKHPIERKARFFIDVRGYIKLNAVRGNYVEFGSFRSWTQYAAYKVLDQTGMIVHYLGLDVFTGEPTPSLDEAGHMPVMAQGDFSCDFQSVSAFVHRRMGAKGSIIQGDFREAKIKEQIRAFAPFNLILLDCNLISSMQAALDTAMDGAVFGAALFIDDYFTNFGKGEAIIAEITDSSASRHGFRLIEHGFYPPFAKSFILAKR